MLKLIQGLLKLSLSLHVPKTRLCQRNLSSLVSHGLHAQLGHAIHVLSVSRHFQKSASARQIKLWHKPRNWQGNISVTCEKMLLHKKTGNWPGPKEYSPESTHVDTPNTLHTAACKVCL